MERAAFLNRLSAAVTPDLLAELAEELFEDACNISFYSPEESQRSASPKWWAEYTAPSRISSRDEEDGEDDDPELFSKLQDEFLLCVRDLLDNGWDPNRPVGDSLPVFDLQYGYTDAHLEAAKMIFDRHGLPAAEIDGSTCSFFGWIGTKIDYNYYNSDFLVRMYLLCCAYTDEETFLHFNPNVYVEMLDQNCCYTSSVCLSPDSHPLILTPEIFKHFDQFDFMVEMLPQERGQCGCWKLHIFDRESKIEVATYE